MGNQGIIMKLLFNLEYKCRWINVICFLSDAYNINAVS